MDILPLELIYFISTGLPVYTLAINKSFHALYTYQWFYDYLQRHYSDNNLLVDNAKELYYKSLRMGNIYKIYKCNDIQTLLPINGIDVKNCGLIGNSLILSFDGTLYITNDYQYKTLTTDVINLDTSSYLTKDTCYLINDCNWNLEVKSELMNIPNGLPFIKHKLLNGIIYVLTTKYLYYIFLNRKTVTYRVEFEEAVDIGSQDLSVVILEANGNLYIIDQYNVCKTLRSANIKSIKSHLITYQTGDQMISLNHNILLPVPGLISNSINLVKNIIMVNEEIIMHTTSGDLQFYTLTNELTRKQYGTKLTCVNRDNSIFKDVKYLTDDWSSFYVIK